MRWPYRLSNRNVFSEVNRFFAIWALNYPIFVFMVATAETGVFPGCMFADLISIFRFADETTGAFYLHSYARILNAGLLLFLCPRG